MKPLHALLRIVTTITRTTGVSLILGLIFMLFPLVSVTRAGGLTIITHGFQPASQHQSISWVKAMADYVNDRAGGTAAVYTIVVDRVNGSLQVVDFSHDSGQTLDSSSNSNSEVVIKLYWDNVAALGQNSATTGEVAGVALPYLLN